MLEPTAAAVSERTTKPDKATTITSETSNVIVFSPLRRDADTPGSSELCWGKTLNGKCF